MKSSRSCRASTISTRICGAARHERRHVRFMRLASACVSINRLASSASGTVELPDVARADALATALAAGNRVMIKPSDRGTNDLLVSLVDATLMKTSSCRDCDAAVGRPSRPCRSIISFHRSTAVGRSVMRAASGISCQ